MLLAVAVVSATVSTSVQSDHTFRVAHECNGKLPLATSAFVAAWGALCIGMITLALAIAYLRIAGRVKKQEAARQLAEQQPP